MCQNPRVVIGAVAKKRGSPIANGGRYSGISSRKEILAAGPTSMWISARRFFDFGVSWEWGSQDELRWYSGR
ncbi:uncharacterized protein Bfra_009654 [Botrytis fragariae]|uniref:Uncharacterized protein n=1 Tax=Botrytis fragariae TaxID=1964551 RepID=A0A8H6EFH6_9HELO|nr:uncharacterized protein Bfra_009654 [Botrytis fragariae]KAF5870271.1 hypothetical protein Bfra_009654 [Botrytis fragariae]